MRLLLSLPLVFVLGLACPQAQTPADPVVDKPTEVERSPAGLEMAAVEIDADSGALRFEVELAKTDPQRQKGLMFRTELAADKGMLFLFNGMRVQRFWMKNTLIPLDMIFIDDKGVIVGIVENAEPETLSGRSVGKPSQYVLELAGGASRRLGIRAGQRARFIGVPGHPAGLEQ
jgi:uncharacterized membrane protein (UPF0127 family)